MRALITDAYSFVNKNLTSLSSRMTVVKKTLVTKPLTVSITPAPSLNSLRFFHLLEAGTVKKRWLFKINDFCFDTQLLENAKAFELLELKWVLFLTSPRFYPAIRSPVYSLILFLIPNDSHEILDSFFYWCCLLEI